MLIIAFWAQQSWGTIRVRLSPPIYNVETTANSNLSYAISLQNNSDEPLSLRTRVKSLAFDTHGNAAFPDAPFEPHSCQTWISVDPKSIVLAARQKRSVDVNIEVPSDAAGGYYAAILFETDKTQASQGHSTVGLQLRTGSLVSLKIRRTIRLDVKIASLSLSNSREQTQFKITLRNDSNCHINPSGSIVIFNQDQRIIDRLTINDSTFMLPGSERTFTLVWDNKRKRVPGTSYAAECRVVVRGLGKSLSYRTEPFNI